MEPSNIPSLLKGRDLIFPGNLGRIVDRPSEIFPDRTGIALPGRLLTFGQCHDQVCRLVHAFGDLGIRRDDRVLLMAHNSLDYALIALATFRLGAILVPVNPAIRHYELEHILGETDPKLVLCECRNLPRVLKTCEFLKERAHPLLITVDGPSAGVRTLTDLDLSRRDRATETMAPDDTAMIVYTAGTDGYYLGAELTHGSLFYDAACCADECFRGTDAAGDVILTLLPLYHCHGFTSGFLAPMIGGSPTIPMDSYRDTRQVIKVMEDFKVTQLVSVPTIYGALLSLLKEKPDVCARLTNVTSGGASAPMYLLKQYASELGLNIGEGYGLTQASPVVTWNRPDRPPKMGTTGYPLPCCQVKIVDDNGRQVPAGREGHILVQGLNLFRGYYKHPEKTRDAFVDGWFKTGDLGYLDEENYLTWTGLTTDMINMFGFKVYPKEVERILRHHPDVDSIRIYGDTHDKYGTVVACDLTLRKGHSFHEREFHKWCRQNISPYKIPRKVVVRQPV